MLYATLLASYYRLLLCEKSNTTVIIFSARIPIEDYLTSTNLECVIRNSLMDALL